MKVLVATKLGQGRESGDYSWTVEGELVTPITVECSSPVSCGCGRGFPGLASSRATTTAMVVSRDEIQPQQLRQALTDSLRRDGWLKGLNPAERRELVEAHFSAITRVCNSFAVGTVVQRVNSLVWSRAAAA